MDFKRFQVLLNRMDGKYLNAQCRTLNALRKKDLVSDTECIFNRMPSLKIDFFQISHQSSSLADKLEKPQSGRVVFFIDFKVFCQVFDSLCQ